MKGKPSCRDIDISQSNSNVSCNICERSFTTDSGLLLLWNACRRKQQDQQNRQLEAMMIKKTLTACKICRATQ